MFDGASGEKNIEHHRECQRPSIRCREKPLAGQPNQQGHTHNCVFRGVVEATATRKHEDFRGKDLLPETTQQQLNFRTR